MTSTKELKQMLCAGTWEETLGRLYTDAAKARQRAVLGQGKCMVLKIHPAGAGRVVG